jgi:hypothetical protein
VATKTKQKPADKAKKYTWILSPEYGILCYPHHLAQQTLTDLWEAQELTAFHDAEMAQATKQINAILSSVERRNKDPERKLSFIEFQNRHFLVWAGYGAVGPDDDDATIVKALGLKSK